MRVILLSWEYPPRIVGKLAEYVSALTSGLAKNGIHSHVVTYHDSMTGSVTESDGVNVVRVANPVKTHVNVLTWMLSLNVEVERASANIYYENFRKIDILDAHDWHFIPTAVILKKAFGIPFIFSIDSLEDHRSPGSIAPLNMAIKGIEWLGFYEAESIISKSEWMKNEIIKIHSVPKEKIKVIAPYTDKWIKTEIQTYKSLGGSKSIERSH